MNTQLESSILKDNINKEIPTPVEFDKDILPLSVKKIFIDKSDQNIKFIINNIVNENNKTRCWDKDGIRNNNPKHSSCVVFKREKEPLLDQVQPKFNSSIHKNISDPKENEWLFSPTRLEVDHNLNFFFLFFCFLLVYLQIIYFLLPKLCFILLLRYKIYF